MLCCRFLLGDVRLCIHILALLRVLVGVLLLLRGVRVFLVLLLACVFIFVIGLKFVWVVFSEIFLEKDRVALGHNSFCEGENSVVAGLKGVGGLEFFPATIEYCFDLDL